MTDEEQARLRELETKLARLEANDAEQQAAVAELHASNGWTPQHAPGPGRGRTISPHATAITDRQAAAQIVDVTQYGGLEDIPRLREWSKCSVIEDSTMQAIGRGEIATIVLANTGRSEQLARGTWLCRTRTGRVIVVGDRPDAAINEVSLLGESTRRAHESAETRRSHGATRDAHEATQKRRADTYKGRHNNEFPSF